MPEKLSMTQVRKILNINQEEFGKPAGLDQRQVSARENKKVPWRFDEALMICKAFGIDPADLSWEP